MSKVKKESFRLYNRKRVVPKAAEGMAIYTFDQLCGSDKDPYGAADYLKLCQLYHTIIIQNIPQMGLTEKNEARRFITFIDAAYENKVKLIVSAETDPERLFVISDIARDESADAFMHKEMMGELLTDMQNVNREETPSEMMKLAIFPAEDEKFAFKRAVSRIKEMQTSYYLSQAHSPVASQVPEKLIGLHKGRGLDPTAKTDIKNIRDEDVPPPSRMTDDFGDEASYSGYIRMYQRFNNDAGEPEPILDAMKRKEDGKPKFKEQHFWGVGDKWGQKAGQWGKGIKAFFIGNKKKDP